MNQWRCTSLYRMTLIGELCIDQQCVIESRLSVGFLYIAEIKKFCLHQNLNPASELLLRYLKHVTSCARYFPFIR